MANCPKIDTMRDRLGRPRKRRQLFDRGIFDGEAPAEHHDVLVVPPSGVYEPTEFVRFPVVKTSQVNQGQLDESKSKKGTYVDPPEVLDPYDYSQRRVMAISRPQDAGPEQHRDVPRGVAFGTLPVKAEPAATACGTCYLINTQNLTFRNAWTAEEWNTIRGVPDLPAAPSADDDSFEVLLAGPRGKVFHLVVNLGEQPQGGEWKDFWEPKGQPKDLGTDPRLGSIECIDLRHETEIWNQLRNGLVAGRVLFQKRVDQPVAGRANPVPLVNITSLIPDEPPSGQVARAGS
jgi:hypothetical protein